MQRMSSGNPIPGGCSGVVARRRLLEDTGCSIPNSRCLPTGSCGSGSPPSEPSVWRSAGVLYVVHPSQMTRDIRAIDVEFHRFLTRIEPHRSVHGHLKVEPIYLWMGTKQWQSGHRLDAARRLLADKTLRQRAAGRAYSPSVRPTRSAFAYGNPLKATPLQQSMPSGLCLVTTTESPSNKRRGRSQPALICLHPWQDGKASGLREMEAHDRVGFGHGSHRLHI